MRNYIRIVISIILFVCLADMPYGYYQFVRVVAMIGFAILAYGAYEEKHNQIMIVYIGMALLFQPFVKIALGRELWNIVDVVVGVGLFISIIIDKRRSA